MSITRDFSLSAIVAGFVTVLVGFTSSAVIYVLIGLFGATVGALFTALPHELVAAIAGLALIGTIGNGLAAAMAAERDREAALVTFLVTASGVTLFGIGSAFWGLVAGGLALPILHPKAKG
ncbi:MAG: benzoate/H(+) symporter BenE family transporter [Betaproteobacteria bacterium]|nr:benzoate/H(+) symporter BenE family transporter [Betaproteobacteria bacterium]